MNIGKFSVENPVFLNILMVSLLVLGGLGLSRMPREQFPEVPFYVVDIVVPYPGVSAEDMEKLVTIPIENEMQGLDELKDIQSITAEGVSTVEIEFNSGISSEEFDKLFQEVRTRFSKVTLPDDVLEATLDDFSSNDFLPVIEVVLTGVRDFARLREGADLLYDRLIRVTDVSSISLVGSRDRQIFIETSRPRMEALGISVLDVLSSIQEHNRNIPAGSIVSEGRQYLVRSIGEVESVEELKDIIIRRNGSESTRIGEVGEIKDGYDPRGVRARFNGETSIILRVAKVPGGNSIAVIDDIRRITSEWQGGSFEDFSVSYQSDSTLQIKESISVLMNNALFGLLLLVILLFIFVGLRNALITALGIPVTFAVTFLILELTGETFNSNTLFALVLVLGLIVDHAIVIIENSFRLEQDGLSRHFRCNSGDQSGRDSRPGRYGDNCGGIYSSNDTSRGDRKISEGYSSYSFYSPGCFNSRSRFFYPLPLCRLAGRP